MARNKIYPTALTGPEIEELRRIAYEALPPHDRFDQLGKTPLTTAVAKLDGRYVIYNKDRHGLPNPRGQIAAHVRISKERHI